MSASPVSPSWLRLACILLMLNMFGCKSTKTDPTIKLPVVGAAAVSDIASTAAKATSRLTDVGAGVTGVPTIKEYGICFGTKENPTITDSKITAGNATTAAADMSATLTGLTPGTAYFVRGYATHEGGTVYGGQATFTTLSLKAPELTTADAIDVGTTSCLIVGNLTGLGSSNVVQHGHVWSSTNQNPTTADSKTELGAASSVPKEIRSGLFNLKTNTTYYVRAYATNATGTGYTDVKTFKTKNEAAPSVTTQVIDLVTGSTARGTGTISSAGTQPVTQYGHVWSSTNQNPTPTDGKTEFGSTTTPKDYASSLGGLSANTTYYVRAYATNSVGTGYGETKTIKTANVVAPTVETGTPSTIAVLYAYVDGVRLLTLGTAPVTQFGLCWSSTNQNPTPADSKDERGPASSPTYFIASMPNLSAGTTYYYRTYATSSAGTGYGAVKTLTTRAYTPPVFSTNAAQWFSSEAEVVFKFAVGSDIERINAYGVVENNSTDKNMPDPAIENVNSFFYQAQRDISTTERNSLNANQALELHLFIRKGGASTNPTGLDSGLTITNGNSTKAVYKKLRAYVIGASGRVYYAPLLKNF